MLFRSHNEHKDVQLRGCWALSNLAVKDDNKKAIAVAGGIPVVLAAMKAHNEHKDVQEHGCWALGNIGWSDATLQKRIKDEGGVAVVQAAVAASGVSAQCQEIGQTLLAKLTQV